MHSSLKTLSLYFGGAIAFNTSGENGIVGLVFLLAFTPLGEFLHGVLCGESLGGLFELKS